MIFNTLLLLFALVNHSLGLGHESSHIGIAGPKQLATDIGLEIARKGGNAVDVAVATGFALAVTSPYYASLGGGGFAVVKMGDELRALDFRESAPKLMDENFFKGKDEKASRVGGQAVGTPGVVAGLYEMHQTYGKLPWSQLVGPAIQIAKNGFEVSGEWVALTKRSGSKFDDSSKRFFPSTHKPGEKLVQAELAKALKFIADKGKPGFYEGPVAEDLVATVSKSGGPLSLQDLKDYKAIWRDPIRTQFAGYDLAMMPPPSSGGLIVAHNLALYEKVMKKKSKAPKPLSALEFHLFGEIMSRSFRERVLFADPSFVNNPTESFLSAEKIQKTASSISWSRTKKLDPIEAVEFMESPETTHFSVLTQSGDAVSLTVTLNGNYGAGVTTEKFGIALNNEIDDFTTVLGRPNMFGLIQGKANLVGPGKRPLSSMSPTLVLKDGKVVMSLGSPGGPRIINAVTQVLIRTLAQNLTLDEAIRAPRVHHQFRPHQLIVDKGAVSPEVIDALKRKGHNIKESWVAKVYGVRITGSGTLESAGDHRGEVGVSGY